MGAALHIWKWLRVGEKDEGEREWGWKKKGGEKSIKGRRRPRTARGMTEVSSSLPPAMVQVVADFDPPVDVPDPMKNRE